MLFNSIHFLLFLPIVLLLNYITPKKFRWLTLVAASCYFYAAFIPEYIFILLFTIIIDYYVGIYLDKWKEENDKPGYSKNSKRKILLIASLIANIGVLVIFKYNNFFIENVNTILQLAGFSSLIPAVSLILPIGLSFHTFQSMSYIIEVYWEKQKAETHFGFYWLYVMYFPQLVAGPIERPGHLINQLRARTHTHTHTKLISKV